MNSATSDSDKARLAAARGDYATAVRHWRHLADGGDSVAQFNLGFSFAQGQGVPQDKVQAARWYRLAAEQGHADAQYRLGQLASEYAADIEPYAETTGEGVEDAKTRRKDASEDATDWFRMAAEQGHADAQFALGQRYRHSGYGIGGKGASEDDYGEAAKWYRAAAMQGHPLARVSLGIMSMNGEGMQQDFLQAHMWFDLAASCEANPKHRAYVIDMRTAAAQKMTPAQIAEVQKLAREWKPK